VLGTAQYLSPEQAQGLEVTETSDIYSIGVILYEALTGRVPFDAETPVAVALKQISEQPRAPSEVKPGVPKALDGIVLRALAKDPQNRFPSAGEFLRALAAAEADPHTDALGETSAYGALGARALAGAAAGAALGAGDAEGATPTGEAGTGETELAPGEAEGTKRKWITRNRAIALAAIALAGAGVAAWALTRVEQVRVPSVIEEQLTTARGLLEQRGFEVTESPVPSCTPVNTITEQDPRAGDEADEGSEVTLTVSLGLAVTIPPVRGETEADAKERIERENLLVDSRTQGSREIPAGRVIKTEPPAGTEVDCDSGVVTLVVSSGPNLVTLPDVLGDTQQLAESRLERRGFIVDVDTRDDEAPEGTVIGQNPGPGSRLRRGARVTVVVSSGAPTIPVPNVEGQPEDTAVSTLQSRGLNVRIETQETDLESEDGRVLDQAPTAGTDALSGDTVTIFVGEFVEEPEIGPGTTTPTTPEEETEEAPR
jgi:serine/threonine-protein kinase